MANGHDKRMVLRDSDRGNLSPFGMWDDFDDLFNAFRRDIDRMFWNPMVPEPPRIRVFRRQSYMPMNLEDKGENMELTVELPGIKKEDAKISLDEDILNISVETEDEKEQKEDGKYLLRERSSFSCSRSIRLPQEVDESKVSAQMVEGVLHVTLPKKHPQKKEKTEIKIE
ncbi:MAG: Hsp20/alpha crystallin family protein [Thermoplasmatota archaeon]